MNQKIFKSSFVADLRDKVKSGSSLCDYLKKKIDYPADVELESTIKVNPDKLKLKFKGQDESASNDIDNAIAIYEAYPDLNETQASDPRLWTYLSHVTLRDYVLARWPLTGTCEQIMNDKTLKASAINFVLSHWFASSNDRMLRRNAIARLWWAVHLTRAPWERDPEFFGDLKSDDPYRFTRILLLTQDIYQNVLERGLGRDNRILMTILEFIEANKDLASRYPTRDFIKELNLMLSVRNFAILGRKEMREAIFSIGSEVLEAQQQVEK